MVRTSSLLPRVADEHRVGGTTFQLVGFCRQHSNRSRRKVRPFRHWQKVLTEVASQPYPPDGGPRLLRRGDDAVRTMRARASSRKAWRPPSRRYLTRRSPAYRNGVWPHYGLNPGESQLLQAKDASTDADSTALSPAATRALSTSGRTRVSQRLSAAIQRRHSSGCNIIRPNVLRA